MHSIAEDFPKNLSFILILGACDYRTPHSDGVQSLKYYKYITTFVVYLFLKHTAREV